MSDALALLDARILPARADGADAVLVRAGRIVAVDSSAAVQRACGPEVTRIDLRGRVLVPGFQDAHFHFLQYGQWLARPSLAACRSLDEWRAMLDDALRAAPGTDVLFAEGWDESGWTTRTRPARADLDALAPGRPVVARRVCGHFAVANSAALRLLASRWNGPGIDPASGHVDEEPALALDELFPPDAAGARAALDAAARACAALGITTACDFLRPRALDAYAVALREADLGVRVTAWVLEDCMAPDGSIPRDPGTSDRFVVRGLKIFGDGTIGGRTAALFEDYADRPGTRGRLLVEPARMAALVARAHRAGRAVAIHAIGDRTIAVALDAFAAAPREENEARGHRIEHLELPRREDIERLPALGVRPCVQPNFLRWAGPDGLYETALGAARLRGMNPFRTLVDAGARPFFGSDGMPAGPGSGIRAARDHPVVSERLSPDLAIRLYTEEAAVPGRAVTGRIAPGEIADLAVFADRPDRLPDPGRADLTLVDGRIVHGAAA